MSARHASAPEALLTDEAFDGDFYPNEMMGKHTSYQIGGPARFFVIANSVPALTSVIRCCADECIPWTIVGRGSNLLVADAGYPGAVIVLGRDFKVCRFDEEAKVFCVGAGVALAAVVQDAFRRAYAGLEFAVGTPGTIGGALRMNAGTRNTWLGSRVAYATTFSVRDGITKRAGSEIAWGYRTSGFLPDEVILECELQVEEADPFYIRGKMEALLASRRKNQPLAMPSCGSVFKNPAGDSAGRLIDAAGLKGYTVGGAQVSPVHANFIVNTGGATAADVRAVMDHVRETVLSTFGVSLEPEVRFLGFEG